MTAAYRPTADAGCVDVRRDRGDLAVLDSDVAYGAELILAVDYVPALEDKVVIILGRGNCRDGQRQ